MSHKLITGQKVPEATFLTLKDDNVVPVTTAQAFGGKKVVVFGLPGALYVDIFTLGFIFFRIDLTR